MSKIFISIASYRDPELLPTIKSIIENAKNSEDLVFCIGWQHSEEDTWDTLDEYKEDPRFIIIDIPYKEAKGVCWMRAEIQKMYSGEKYYLQLDSHHRFAKDWDIFLKDSLHMMQCRGYLKPLISSYIPSYFPDTDPEGRIEDIWGLNIDRFMPGGAIFLTPYHINNWRELKEPFPSRFVSGHFIFTLGTFVKEVPYDEELYFHGEESSLAARAYTYGYDLFGLHRPIVWHEYTREGKKKHWDDSSDWVQRDSHSYARYRKLMGMDPGCTECQRNKIAPHYFGPNRTFAEYERYAGLKFSTRQIHVETKKDSFPPIKGDYESGLTYSQKHCLDVYKGSLPENDYDHFVVAFLDENGNDLYRRDADRNEIVSLFSNPDDQFIHIWREYEDNKKAHSWRVWPHSLSKGWMDRIENVIEYE